MNDDKLLHCVLGFIVSVATLTALFFVDNGASIQHVLTFAAFFGALWALTIGHGLYFLLIPIAILQYFLIPPLKLRNGRAFEESGEVLVYCIMPDRIILVRDFSSIESIESKSLFLTGRMMVKTKLALAASSAIQLNLDADSAVLVYDGELPSIEDFDASRIERSLIDSIHNLVIALWNENKDSPQGESVLHPAVWYALAADRYFDIEHRSWLEHALL